MEKEEKISRNSRQTLAITEFSGLSLLYRKGTATPRSWWSLGIPSWPWPSAWAILSRWLCLPIPTYTQTKWRSWPQTWKGRRGVVWSPLSMAFPTAWMRLKMAQFRSNGTFSVRSQKTVPHRNTISCACGAVFFFYIAIYRAVPGKSVIPTRCRISYSNGFCFRNMISYSFDYLIYPYYPAYTMGCYQFVIKGDNKDYSLGIWITPDSVELLQLSTSKYRL